MTDAQKFCQSCGSSILQAAEICPKCGVRQAPPPASVSDEEAPGGAKVASFCFPFVGLILYLAWQGSKPRAASGVCSAALWGMGVGMFFYVLSLLVGAGAGL